MRIYLDNASTTQISQEVLDVMIPAMQAHYGNPSSIHAEGRQVRAAIENARKTIANQLNASIGEIFFTSGGTESNNMAIKCAVRDLGVKRIISSPIEHHCVLHTLDHLREHHGVEVHLLKVDAHGRINYEELATVLSMADAPKTLVSLMHANNEIGTLLDMNKVSELCQSNNALFHSDTVQTMTHFPIDVEELKIDFFSGSAHKFHGPKGVGFIYINGNNNIKPLLDGGSQERNMRGGTENVYGIVGIAKAMELACTNMSAWKETICDTRDYLIEQLKNRVEDIQFNTPLDEESLYTVLSVSFPKSDRSEMLLLGLDIAGISCSGGSACTSGSEKGSHVVEALNADPGRKTIRFSFSHYNTREDIDQLMVVLEKLVATKGEKVG